MLPALVGGRASDGLARVDRGAAREQRLRLGRAAVEGTAPSSGLTPTRSPVAPLSPHWLGVVLSMLWPAEETGPLQFAPCSPAPPETIVFSSFTGSLAARLPPAPGPITVLPSTVSFRRFAERRVFSAPPAPPAPDPAPSGPPTLLPVSVSLVSVSAPLSNASMAPPGAFAGARPDRGSACAVAAERASRHRQGGRQFGPDEFDRAAPARPFRGAGAAFAAGVIGHERAARDARGHVAVDQHRAAAALAAGGPFPAAATGTVFDERAAGHRQRPFGGAEVDPPAVALSARDRFGPFRPGFVVEELAVRHPQHPFAAVFERNGTGAAGARAAGAVV